MTKKSFKDNPALQFISAPQETEVVKADEIIDEDPKTVVKLKKNPIYIETKSKRVQLLMQPTLHSQLSKLAKKKNISLNDLVHKTLEMYIESE